MKKTIIGILAAVIPFAVAFAADPRATDLRDIKDAYEVCVTMRSAINSGTNESLRAANSRFKALKVGEFVKLRRVGGSEISLDGHFVFDEDFVDSLVVNRKTFAFAQRYARARRQRGTSGRGSVSASTYAVGAGARLRFSLATRGRQEIAVVTEPGGAINLNILDKSSGKWYRTTSDIRKGSPVRILVLELSANKVSTIEIEIENVGDSAVSFVIIGN